MNGETAQTQVYTIRSLRANLFGRATVASAVHGKQNNRTAATTRERWTGANARARTTSSHTARSAIRPSRIQPTSRRLTTMVRSSTAVISQPRRLLT